jgi:PPOX class probable F420-dependent enzyme
LVERGSILAAVGKHLGVVSALRQLRKEPVMGQLQMTTAERESFLADRHVGVLSVERASGPPLVTPVWYRYEPGGAVEISTDASSVKGRLLAAKGRATLCAQREELPYAYVTVDGPVTFGEATDEARLEIAERYLGTEMAQAYLAANPGGDNTLVRLSPQRWYTVDYAKLGIPTG